jgi:hypothetical protein
MDTRNALRAVKLVHTIIWAFFVAVIVAIPVAAWYRRFDLFLAFTAIVLVEVGVLAVNGFRCPLTPIAGRFTEDRRDNFDIYLPLFVARYNKEIFGTLFVGGLLFGLVRALT